MLDEGKNEIWGVRYAYRVLGNYHFIAADLERERSAVGKPVCAPGGGAKLRIGRAVWSGFFARTAGAAGGICEQHARIGSISHDRPGGPRDRAGTRSH